MFPTVLNLADLCGINGFTINGANKNDFSGNSVSRAGDVNGDGIGDIIISAPTVINGEKSYGQYYVVFGSKKGFSSSISLGTLSDNTGFILMKK